VDWFTSSQDQNDNQPIVYISNIIEHIHFTSRNASFCYICNYPGGLYLAAASWPCTYLLYLLRVQFLVVYICLLLFVSINICRLKCPGLSLWRPKSTSFQDLYDSLQCLFQKWYLIQSKWFKCSAKNSTVDLWTCTVLENVLSVAVNFRCSFAELDRIVFHWWIFNCREGYTGSQDKTGRVWSKDIVSDTGLLAVVMLYVFAMQSNVKCESILMSSC